MMPVVITGHWSVVISLHWSLEKNITLQNYISSDFYVFCFLIARTYNNILSNISRVNLPESKPRIQINTHYWVCENSSLNSTFLTFLALYLVVTGHCIPGTLALLPETTTVVVLRLLLWDTSFYSGEADSGNSCMQTTLTRAHTKHADTYQGSLHGHI